MGDRPKQDKMLLLTVDIISASYTLLVTVCCPTSNPKGQRNSSNVAVQAAAVKSHWFAQILSASSC